MTTEPILNPEAIQALRDLSPDGDDQFLQELIGIYLTDTPQQIAEMEAAITRKDAAIVLRTAHTLKGSSGNFGAEEFTQIAKEIEEGAKDNNLDAAAALLPAFKGSYERVVGALKQLAGN